VFPAGYSELFATASFKDIRVWNARTCAELLRVQIPSLDCYAICFSRDGRAVLSGWSDGKIRAFGPQVRQNPPPSLVLSGHAASLTPY
jgi:WD40 repeat protein